MSEVKVKVKASASKKSLSKHLCVQFMRVEARQFRRQLLRKVSRQDEVENWLI